MKQTVSMEDLKASAGEIVNSVRMRGDRYIISRYGKPSAAIVPLRVLEAYERNREKLFAMIDEVHDRNNDLDSDEIQKLVDDEVAAVRAERRSNKKGDKESSH